MLSGRQAFDECVCGGGVQGTSERVLVEMMKGCFLFLLCFSALAALAIVVRKWSLLLASRTPNSQVWTIHEGGSGSNLEARSAGLG
eukprot:1387963-Rhodomonas_salina.1